MMLRILPRISKNRRPVIVNLEQATPELARRVVDFCDGGLLLP